MTHYKKLAPRNRKLVHSTRNTFAHSWFLLNHQKKNAIIRTIPIVQLLILTGGATYRKLNRIWKRNPVTSCVASVHKRNMAETTGKNFHEIKIMCGYCININNHLKIYILFNSYSIQDHAGQFMTWCDLETISYKSSCKLHKMKPLA